MIFRKHLVAALTALFAAGTVLPVFAGDKKDEAKQEKPADKAKKDQTTGSTDQAPSSEKKK
jgi:hypothetical protein